MSVTISALLMRIFVAIGSNHANNHERHAFSLSFFSFFTCGSGPVTFQIRVVRSVLCPDRGVIGMTTRKRVIIVHVSPSSP
ncbi:hypothetical protein BC940DRAFT_307780 [Gongronella butleri]|nr:hypothetical protein BC940DRAFT_307780 [Gongronella butleri]